MNPGFYKTTLHHDHKNANGSLRKTKRIPGEDQTAKDDTSYDDIYATIV